MQNDFLSVFIGFHCSQLISVCWTYISAEGHLLIHIKHIISYTSYQKVQLYNKMNEQQTELRGFIGSTWRDFSALETTALDQRRR